MNKFKDVSFSYKEEDFVIKSNQMMKAIRCLSGVCGIGHLADAMNNAIHVSDGFHALLSFCGSKDKDEDVYEWIMEELANGKNSRFTTAYLAVSEVITPLAVPPEKIKKYSPKKPKTPVKKKAKK